MASNLPFNYHDDDIEFLNSLSDLWYTQLDLNSIHTFWFEWSDDKIITFILNWSWHKLFQPNRILHSYELQLPARWRFYKTVQIW